MVLMTPNDNTNVTDSEYTLPSKQENETRNEAQSRNETRNEAQSRNETEALSTDMEVMNLLSKQFTYDQLQMLTEMLTKMKVKNDSDVSPTNGDLGYLVHKTADTLSDKL